MRIVCADLFRGPFGCKQLVGARPGSVAFGVFGVGRARRAFEAALGLFVWGFVLQSNTFHVCGHSDPCPGSLQSDDSAKFLRPRSSNGNFWIVYLTTCLRWNAGSFEGGFTDFCARPTSSCVNREMHSLKVVYRT